MAEIKIGDIVCLRSDGTRSVVMTVEGPARAREDLSAALINGQFKPRAEDVSCVWVDRNGNVRHDDFGTAALMKVKD